VIFSWLRPKSSKPKDEFSQLLELKEEMFVDVISQMIVQQHAVSSAMCVVAFQNLNPILSATRQYAEKNPDYGLPTTVEETILLLSKDRDNQDEISERRRYWFLYALLIKRATTLCEGSPSMTDACARMWAALAGGGRSLETSLAHNMIWSELEKAWFSQIKSEQDGLKYVLNHIVPNFLRSNPALKEFALDAGIRWVAGRYS
jgi:hypothetical protein